MELSGEAGNTAVSMLQFDVARSVALQLPSLQKLACTIRPSAALLAALPSSLLQLYVVPAQGEEDYERGPKAVAQGVADLTNLRSLHLGKGCCSMGVLTALKQMTCLTQLKLCDSHMKAGTAEFKVLQEVLPCLTNLEVLEFVEFYWELDYGGSYKVNYGLALGGLKALKQLSFDLDYGFTGEGVVLPAGLTELTLDCCNFMGHTVHQHMKTSPLRYMQLMSLEDLRHLTLRLDMAQLVKFPDGLQALLELTQLDRLDLEYEDIDTAHKDCIYWPRLPLTGICVRDHEFNGDVERDHEEMQEDFLAVMPQMQETLTRLELHFWDNGCDPESDAGHEVFMCRQLCGLTNLKKLCLSPFVGEPAAQDCMQLSGLRSLTHLDLCHMGAGVDDAVAAALVGSMPQLRHLALRACDVKSGSVVVPPDCQLLM